MGMSLDDIIKKNKKSKPAPKGHQKAQNKQFKHKTLKPHGQRQGSNRPGPPYIQKRVVKPAKKPAPAKNHLYLSSLDPSVTCEDLRNHFGQVGELTLCKIHWDLLGNSKGQGELKFSTPEEAQNAVEQLHGSELKGANISVQLYERKS